MYDAIADVIGEALDASVMSRIRTMPADQIVEVLSRLASYYESTATMGGFIDHFDVRSSDLVLRDPTYMTITRALRQLTRCKTS
jgi:hypothetical protein